MSHLKSQIYWPDGQQKELVLTASVQDSLSSKELKSIVAFKSQGKIYDLTRVPEAGAEVYLIAANSEEGVEVIRHSCAHLLAQAVKMLFPQVQVTIGPVIDKGFYYDFAHTETFSHEQLEAIEKTMHKLANQAQVISREEWQRDKAVEFFTSIGEHYKAEIIQSIPENEAVSLYRQGDFIDLCRGPHVPHTGHLKAFKLLRVSGAYWRGDAKNAMLQRIYGTAWASEEDLRQYLFQIEEAEKRDHRKLGNSLDLFHMQEEAPGMVFWHSKGWTLWRVVEDYLRRQLQQSGYQEVKTPQIADRSLWEASGHWQMYRQYMFETASESRDYVLKPMNCPCHIQIFKQGVKSYRDLPLRMSEFGACHRNEPSGALHGLMRVRAFTQDDAHIFCAEESIESESQQFIALLQKVYRHFGFERVIYRLSTRPQQRMGSDQIWDRAESALTQALNSASVSWQLQPGEGAFYGPKIEFSLEDSIGRVWQCGTLQVDFVLPERLDAEYVDADNQRKRPVMLHRALLGSMERFLGILIEHHAGAFPLWLAPVQMVVMNLTSDEKDYAVEVAHKLRQQGFRVGEDLRNEKINYKIRASALDKTPYQVVVGAREQQSGTVAVRARGGAQSVLSLDQFVAHAQLELGAVFE